MSYSPKSPQQRPLAQSQPVDGFYCPNGCRAMDPTTGEARPQPLCVTTTVCSAPGLVTRYRRCPKCGHHEITWEQKRPTTAPLKVK